MSDFAVEVTRHDPGIGVVTFRREPRNYFSAQMIAALSHVVTELDADGARVVVLRTDLRDFCVGLDLGSADSAGSVGELYAGAEGLFRVRMPVIAQVQGRAIGGGVGLCLAADLRVAAESATFTTNFVRLGLHHGFGLSVTLPWAVGRQRAAELLYTGRMVDADEARSIGLCDRTAPETALEETTLELAREIAGGAPLALRAIRATMRAELARDAVAAMRAELVEQRALFETDDFAEGVAAARARRAPAFAGR